MERMINLEDEEDGGEKSRSEEKISSDASYGS
jgi:hypothetical protein